MQQDNQNVKTGNIAFDNIVTSAELLHEYIKVNDDDTTFALFFGGTFNGEGMMHCINFMLGNLNKPSVFDAALQSIVKTMKESDIVAKLLMAAYNKFKTDRNIKIVKLSVDSPFEAINLLRRIFDDDNGELIDIDELPQEIIEQIADSMPSSLKTLVLEHDCDNPDCMVKKLRRRMKRKGEYVDFSDFLYFSKNNKDDKGN